MHLSTVVKGVRSCDACDYLREQMLKNRSGGENSIVEEK